jgi:hypothetical protein
MKQPSHRTALSIAVAAALATSGCIIVDDDPDVIYQDGGAAFVTIDADQQLTTELGYGAGLFVEYYRGGQWTLWTSCDTELSGHYCDWEVNVASYAPIEGFEGFELEGYDHVDRYGSYGLTFFAETAYDMDLLDFYTVPGELVEIEVLLDGYLAPEYVVWFGNGVVQSGLHDSPVVFQPDAP